MTHITTLPSHKAVTPTVTQDITQPAPTGLVAAWNNFWFAARDPAGLHALRILAGVLFLAWILPFAGHTQALFSYRGWLDAEAYRQISLMPSLHGEESPMPISWSLFYMVGDSPFLVALLYWFGAACFLLLTLGFAVRLTALLSWVMVLSFMANPATRFEADYLLGILAFYLMIGYALWGQWNRKLTPAERILGPRDSWVLFGKPQGEAAPSVGANLAIRLLQVHFALIIVSSGLHKLQMGRWWAGTALWFPLHHPFTTTEAEVRRLAQGSDGYLAFWSLLQYGMLAWQLAFPFFAWRSGRLSRTILIGGALLGWIGAFWIWSLPLFGPVFFIASLAYLTPEEWAGLKERLQGLFAKITGASRAAPTPTKSTARAR